MQNKTYTIALFITSHGFGHAARSCGVMNAINKQTKGIRFELFTSIPQWFFQNSLQMEFGYHSIITDIGLVQKNSMEEDVPATIKELDDFLPFSDRIVDSLAGELRRLGCSLVICDIAALGIVTAKAVNIPSLLIENFTWDWILKAYREEYPQIESFINFYREVFDSADYHIKTTPLCEAGEVDLTIPPISRLPLLTPSVVRDRLGIPLSVKVVMITMGGIPTEYDFLHHLEENKEYFFVIPGAVEKMERRQNILLLSQNSDFYHPDLIHSSDIVIGKLGYSTIAEVYYAGVPFGYIPRKRFRESAVISKFVDLHIPSIEIAEEDFFEARWLPQLQNLTRFPKREREHYNGGFLVAEFILNHL